MQLAIFLITPGTRLGDVAPRIITVGSHLRAQKIAEHLDTISFSFTSKRGFTTITGSYNGVAVSIVAIGMGSGSSPHTVNMQQWLTFSFARFGPRALDQS